MVMLSLWRRQKLHKRTPHRRQAVEMICRSRMGKAGAIWMVRIGGWGWKTERSGDPHRESKPSAHRHRTARTTRQINGAIDFGGSGDLRPIFLLCEVRAGEYRRFPANFCIRLLKNTTFSIFFREVNCFLNIFDPKTFTRLYNKRNAPRALKSYYGKRKCALSAETIL